MPDLVIGSIIFLRRGGVKSFIKLGIAPKFRFTRIEEVLLGKYKYQTVRGNEQRIRDDMALATKNLKSIITKKHKF